MLGKPLWVLVLLPVTTVLCNTELQLETVVTQLIVKDNSPLCLSFDYYELDQVFIIQQHVDTVSVEFYEVYVRFTAVATCKPDGPSSCEDQMRLCGAQFNLNGSDVSDDVCTCDAFPDLSFDFEPSDDSNDARKEKPKAVTQRQDQVESHKVRPNQRKLNDDRTKNEKDEIRNSDVHEQEPALKPLKDHQRIENHDVNSDRLKEIGSLPKGSPRTVEVQHYTPTLSETDPSDNAKKDVLTEDNDELFSTKQKNKVDSPKDKKTLDNDDDSELEELLALLIKRKEEEASAKNAQTSANVDVSLNSIDLLMFIQNAVEAVNNASDGNLSLTLSKILNINHTKADGAYFLQVECNQLNGFSQRCNISCETQSNNKVHPVHLLSYACSPSQVLPNHLDHKKNRVQNPKNPPLQYQLIAQYAMIQMDEIDADDYRRVVLQVTSVGEQITVDGSGVQYSLSVIMVSTACEETRRLGQDSQGCLGEVVSPEQLCNVDCVRSCTSDQPPQLVSSQCGPVPESSGKSLKRRGFMG